MDCPKCHHTLREIKYEGIAIDTCDSCGGEWLDKDEALLVNRARGAVFNDKDRSQIEGAQRPVVKEAAPAPGEMKCPKCKVLLKTFNYAYDSGVMVDRCPQCDGLWLDNGELEALQIVVEEWEKRNPALKAKFASTLQNIQAKEDLKREALLDHVSHSKMGPHSLKHVLKSILYRIF